MNNRWILYRSACYLNGRGLTLGENLLGHEANQDGKFSLGFDVIRGPYTAAVDSRFDIIADGSLDHVFVGRRLESMQSPQETMRELGKKVRVGGHMVMALPLNGDETQQHVFYEHSPSELLEGVGRWGCKAKYTQGNYTLQIFKRLEGRRGVVDFHRKPLCEKRACIVRYGAMGDMVMVTPLLRQLVEDGYEVTVNATPYSVPILNNNPHVHNLLIQERDAIPNLELGEYWKLWAAEYDRYINLSESIEGGLLKVEGRRDFYTHKEWRNKTCSGVNYYDRTLELGGYPETKGTRGELYFTNAEERKAKEFFSTLDSDFTLLWGLNGSSHHKAYPLMENVLREWFAKHPKSKCITVGDHMAKLLEFNHPQLVPKAGEWSIRQSLIATKYVDCVIGPESVMTNAAGCYPTPKVVFLSHSSKENLTKYWENCYELTPDVACHPCNQLHYSRESCPLVTLKDTKTGEEVVGPACIMGAIPPQRVLETLEAVYAQRISKVD